MLILAITKTIIKLSLRISKRPKMNPISSDKEEGSQTFVKWVSNAISYCTTQKYQYAFSITITIIFMIGTDLSVTRKNLFGQWQQILHFLNKIPFSWKASFLDLHQRIRKIKTATSKIRPENNNRVK